MDTILTYTNVSTYANECDVYTFAEILDYYFNNFLQINIQKRKVIIRCTGVQDSKIINLALFGCVNFDLDSISILKYPL